MYRTPARLIAYALFKEGGGGGEGGGSWWWWWLGGGGEERDREEAATLAENWIETKSFCLRKKSPVGLVLGLVENNCQS